MKKKYIVRLTDQERNELRERRQEAERDRPESAACPDPAQGRRRWPELDRSIESPRRSVAETRRSRTSGSALSSAALERRYGSKREQPPVEKLLDGDQEAQIIATRLGPPPRLCQLDAATAGRKVVELGIVESVSYETVRRTLKKTA